MLMFIAGVEGGGEGFWWMSYRMGFFWFCIVSWSVSISCNKTIVFNDSGSGFQCRILKFKSSVSNSRWDYILLPAST